MEQPGHELYEVKVLSTTGIRRVYSSSPYGIFYTLRHETNLLIDGEPVFSQERWRRMEDGLRLDSTENKLVTTAWLHALIDNRYKVGRQGSIIIPADSEEFQSVMCIIESLFETEES